MHAGKEQELAKIQKAIKKITSAENHYAAADALQEFTEVAFACKHRDMAVKEFCKVMDEYRNKQGSHLSKWETLTGASAVSTWLSEMMPPPSTPAQTLYDLQDFANFIEGQFIPPALDNCDEEQIKSIMQYVDGKYDYSTLVFKDCLRPAKFLILPFSCWDRSSDHTVVRDADSKISSFTFYLYHVLPDTQKTNVPSPIKTIFQELGVAMHERILDDSDLCVHVAQALSETFFPAILTLSPEAQDVIIKDVFAMGLLHGSPFCDAKFFAFAEPNAWKFFNELTEVVLHAITPPSTNMVSSLIKS